MARTPKHNFNQADIKSGVLLLDELISLVRNDGHCLTLSARKRLIDIIERHLQKNTGIHQPDPPK